MTALYINGISNLWEGVSFDKIIVDDNDVEQFIKQGYVRHPFEIKHTELKVEKTAPKSRKVKKDELDKKTVN